MDDMPPVTEFWEMPLYDTEGYFHDNPLDRYALNSFMLERGNLHTEYGKLVIYVQHDEPTDPKQRQNWLPAPDGPFYLVLRLYGPEEQVLADQWQQPPVQKA